MKRSQDILSVSYIIFLLFLSLSGSLPGVFGTIFYYLSFILPISFVLILKRDDDLIPKCKALLIPKGTLKFTLPFIAPTIGMVFLISLFTSFVLGLFGFKDELILSGNIFKMIAEHAFLPALLEELLFRFLPIILLLQYSEKNTIFISSLFFSLIHCNLFQIPYALFAGLTLSFLSVMSGSIIPAFIIHFLNNTASVFFVIYNENKIFQVIYIAVLIILSLISIIYLFINRSFYMDKLKTIFKDKSKLEFTLSAFLLILLTLILSVYNLVVIL